MCICVSTSTVVVHTHTRVIRVIFSRADAKIYVDQVQYHGRVHYVQLIPLKLIVSAREAYSAAYIRRRYNKCRVCTPESFQRTRTAGMSASSSLVPVITPHLHHILNFSVVSNLVGRPWSASNKAYYWLRFGHTEHVQTYHCCTASTLARVRGKIIITKILYNCHNRDDPGNYFHDYYKKPKNLRIKKNFYIIILVTILTVFL